MTDSTLPPSSVDEEPLSDESSDDEHHLRLAMTSWTNKYKASTVIKNRIPMIGEGRFSKGLGSELLGPLLISSGISEDSEQSVDEPMNFLKACKSDDENTVELYGCNYKDTKNKKGLPVIQVCINSGAYTVMEKLLQWGVNTSKEGCNGMTALHAAVNVLDYRACSLLLQYGANVNAKSSRDQSTPLHKAAQVNRPDLVRLLLQNGADATVTNSSIEVPSKFALSNYIIHKGKGKRSESAILILQLLEESLLAQRQQRRPLRRKLGSLLSQLRSRPASIDEKLSIGQRSRDYNSGTVTMNCVMSLD